MQHIFSEVAHHIILKTNPRRNINSFRVINKALSQIEILQRQIKLQFTQKQSSRVVLYKSCS